MRINKSVVIVLGLLGSGCVDNVAGSFLAVDFFSQGLVNRAGVSAPALPGDAPAPQQPWAGSHYSFYYVNNVVGEDPGSYWFRAVDFEIQPALDLTEPCLMDDEPTDYPGIHVTQILPRMVEDLGFNCADASGTIVVPDGVSDRDIVSLDLECRRASLLDARSTQLLAVTSYSSADPPATDTVCADDPNADENLIPPTTCYDDASNERRLALCREFWTKDEDSDGVADNRDYFVGNDRVLTLPLNGTYFGMVQSQNPASPGTEFIGAYLESALGTDGLDLLTMTWQFDDKDGDGEPDYPASFPDADRSPVGVTYMSGIAQPDATRGVTAIDMANRLNPTITAAVSAFDLQSDGVTF